MSRALMCGLARSFRLHPSKTTTLREIWTWRNWLLLYHNQFLFELLDWLMPSCSPKHILPIEIAKFHLGGRYFLPPSSELLLYDATTFPRGGHPHQTSTRAAIWNLIDRMYGHFLGSNSTMIFLTLVCLLPSSQKDAFELLMNGPNNPHRHKGIVLVSIAWPLLW